MDWTEVLIFLAAIVSGVIVGYSITTMLGIRKELERIRKAIEELTGQKRKLQKMVKEYSEQR